MSHTIAYRNAAPAPATPAISTQRASSSPLSSPERISSTRRRALSACCR